MRRRGIISPAPGFPQTKKRKEQEAAKRTVGWAVEQFLAAKRPKLRASSFAEVNRYLSDH
ncbi:MAG: hypothetical protein WA728_20405 [Xanthobacteraceae bacterium]